MKDTLGVSKPWIVGVYVRFHALECTYHFCALDFHDKVSHLGPNNLCTPNCAGVSVFWRWEHDAWDSQWFASASGHAGSSWTLSLSSVPWNYIAGIPPYNSV